MKKTIKAQILSGYVLILIVPIILAIVTVVCGVFISFSVQELTALRENQNVTKEAVVGHHVWVNSLGDAILNDDVEFTGSTDPTTCGLGAWMGSVSQEDLADSQIQEALSDLKIPHDMIHNEAVTLLEEAKVDREAAYEKYKNDIKPQVDRIISDITIVTERYGAFANEKSYSIGESVFFMILINVVLVIVGCVVASIYGNTTAKKIANPVKVVALWSKQMALGDNDIDSHEIDNLKLSEENEIKQMIEAFEIMAQSIKGNVNVIKRVSDGDLTAFVDIRSDVDALGKNLYRMVQENDHMFANILNIASEVAASAHQISSASATLSQNTTNQASIIEEVHNSMNTVNTLAEDNRQRVQRVQDAFAKIHDEVLDGTSKMNELVGAVTDIKDASDKISAVIKSIDEISNQTNILALNASIEAARAGQAGKGFAVVADEVRQLALKSAIAAGQSKELIENTIIKAGYGTEIADKTNESFTHISQRVDSTISIADEIVEAALRQAEASREVSQSVETVAAAAESNAAISQQASALSAEMDNNAEILKKEVERFKLRQRVPGKPYIPEEKKNDREFIRIAEENYKKAMESGLVDNGEQAV